MSCFHLSPVTYANSHRVYLCLLTHYATKNIFFFFKTFFKCPNLTKNVQPRFQFSEKWVSYIFYCSATLFDQKSPVHVVPGPWQWKKHTLTQTLQD